MTLIYIIFILFVTGVLVLSKFNIRPQYILIVTFFSYVFGFYISNGDEPYWIYQVILFSLFMVFSLPSSNRINRYGKYSKTTRVYRFNKLLFFTIIMFIVYHYVVGGIPIFQSNVMISRFDMTSSGLFGIPGRMAQYGKNFIFYYSAYFVINNENGVYDKYKKYFYISIAVVLICAVFSGSKSSVLSLLYCIIYYCSFLATDINVKKFLKPKIIIPVLVTLFAGIAYFEYFFIHYNNQYSNMKMMEYFFYRLTSMSAEAGVIVLGDNVNKITYWDEIIYYIQKYFHISLSNRTVYPLEIYASNIMNHKVFTGAYSFYNPVTVGGFVELMYHFGWGTCLVVPILGRLYTYIFKKIKIISQPQSFAYLCLIIQYINTFLDKGGMVFYMINLSLMIMIIGFIDYFSRSLMFTLKRR